VAGELELHPSTGHQARAPPVRDLGIELGEDVGARAKTREPWLAGWRERLAGRKRPDGMNRRWGRALGDEVDPRHHAQVLVGQDVAVEDRGTDDVGPEEDAKRDGSL